MGAFPELISLSAFNADRLNFQMLSSCGNKKLFFFAMSLSIEFKSMLKPRDLIKCSGLFL